MWMSQKIVIPIKSNIIDNDTAAFYDFFGMTDYVSPKRVADQLDQAQNSDTVELQIASNGGDVFAASEIYTLLKSSNATVTAIIQGLAASAASVIAVAADNVQISPTAQIMIHKAWSETQGNSDDMAHQAEVLNGIDDSIVNAYEAKTGMDRGKLLNLMSNETWLGAKDAVTYGFADSIMSFKNDDDESVSDKEKQPLQAFASLGTMVPHAAVNKWQAMMAEIQATKAELEPKPDTQVDNSSQHSDLYNAKLAILLHTNGGNK